MPVTSLPVEVWQACADVFTASVAADFRRSVTTLPSSLPGEMTDCTLVLMPKPGKASKLPKDLRPLGIQDPMSKVVAKALRDQLEVQVSGLLASLPQYAYIKREGHRRMYQPCGVLCDSVRSGLQASVGSVHSRREGCAPSQCYGGIMVGIDLSRAFDTLDRPVLRRTLQFAGVSAPLQRILLEIHNQCQYRVRLGSYEDTFALQCGVRQGCSISPLLFSLFTCWFLTELGSRTSLEWVAAFVTWFADDQHLGWHISQPSDLDYVCKSLRATFGLLKECGMCANPLKSIVTLGLRGNYARHWIKAHLVRSGGQKCINFGIPGQPLPIPVSDTFPYLGTVVSFGGFEMQTCKHRIRAAQSRRSRLLRFLHSRQLSLRRRTTLYVACVRSSLLYLQHAVGITEPVLHLLAATDAKFVRALARSPAHITRESTDLLLRRLHLQSPLQALQALLDRRIQRSQDASAVARMTSTRHLLTNRIAEPSDAAPGSLLRPVESCRWFGCSQCGQCFRTMRDLNTHLTKKHGPRKKPAKPRAGDLMQHAVDGMPQCRHCSAKFTRFEALQKHILGGCPSLFPDNTGCGRAAEEHTVEPLEAEGPSREGTACCFV